MIYCINPDCPDRENHDDADICKSCSTNLLIENNPKSSARRKYRLHLIQPVSELQPRRYSELFEVRDLESGEIRILKILKTPILKRLEPLMYEKLVSLFQREFQTLKALRHSGIPKVKVEDYFSIEIASNPNQLPCICMPKIEGMTLKSWLKKGEKLSQSQAVDWLKQLSSILDYIHTHKPHAVFHRDIKPSNIMLQPDGKLALIDFGGSRPITESYLIKVGTGPNETGTPQFDDVTTLVSTGYTPLEQFNGKALPSSDFYALGRTMVRLMTGRELSNLQINEKTGNTIWRRYAPQIKKPLADLIDEMTAIAPADRPKNTKYLLKEVEKLEIWEKTSRSPYFKVSMGLFAIFFAILSSFAIKELKDGYDQFRAERYFWQARGEQLNNQLDDAKQNYKQSLRLNPNNEEAYNNLGLVCEVQGDLPCAIENYQKAAQTNPNYWLSTFNLATLFEDKGDNKLAEKYYRQVLDNATDIQVVGSASNLSRLKILQGNYDEAKSVVVGVMDKATENLSRARLLKNLGWAEFELGDDKQAEKHLQQAIRLDPEMAAAHCLIAQVYQEQGNNFLAQPSWRTCLRLDSFLPEVEEWKDSVLEKLFQEP